MSGRLLDELITATRSSKPRDTGLTIASDSFSPIEDEVFEQIAEYIDFVKFGLSTPLLIEKSKLLERVSRYHDLGISVVGGGTLIEIAVQRGITLQMLERLRALGFDMIEISESAGGKTFGKKGQIFGGNSKVSDELHFAE